MRDHSIDIGSDNITTCLVAVVPPCPSHLSYSLRISPPSEKLPPLFLCHCSHPLFIAVNHGIFPNLKWTGPSHMVGHHWQQIRLRLRVTGTRAQRPGNTLITPRSSIRTPLKTSLLAVETVATCQPLLHRHTCHFRVSITPVSLVNHRINHTGNLNLIRVNTGNIKTLGVYRILTTISLFILFPLFFTFSTSLSLFFFSCVFFISLSSISGMIIKHTYLVCKFVLVLLSQQYFRNDH